MSAMGKRHEVAKLPSQPAPGKLLHSVVYGCDFILLMVSFAVQKIVSLIRSHLFIFAFISIAWGD